MCTYTQHLFFSQVMTLSEAHTLSQSTATVSSTVHLSDGNRSNCLKQSRLCSRWILKVPPGFFVASQCACNKWYCRRQPVRHSVCIRFYIYNRGGNTIQRLGYFARPSLPSNICTPQYTCHYVQYTSTPHSTSLNLPCQDYLAQPFVLAKCPLRHGKRSCCNEEEGRYCLSCYSKQDPTIDLKGVVSTCDIVEGKALGNDIFLTSFWPQIT